MGCMCYYAAGVARGSAGAGAVETQSVGGSCGAGQPSSQTSSGQSLLYGLQVTLMPMTQSLH